METGRPINETSDIGEGDIAMKSRSDQIVEGISSILMVFLGQTKWMWLELCDLQ